LDYDEKRLDLANQYSRIKEEQAKMDQKEEEGVAPTKEDYQLPARLQKEFEKEKQLPAGYEDMRQVDLRDKDSFLAGDGKYYIREDKFATIYRTILKRKTNFGYKIDYTQLIGNLPSDIKDMEPILKQDMGVKILGKDGDYFVIQPVPLSSLRKEDSVIPSIDVDVSDLDAPKEEEKKEEVVSEERKEDVKPEAFDDSFGDHLESEKEEVEEDVEENDTEVEGTPEDVENKVKEEVSGFQPFNPWVVQSKEEFYQYLDEYKNKDANYVPVLYRNKLGKGLKQRVHQVKPDLFDKSYARILKASRGNKEIADQIMRKRYFIVPISSVSDLIHEGNTLFAPVVPKQKMAMNELANKSLERMNKTINFIKG
jgi:hypothetical protein